MADQLIEIVDYDPVWPETFFDQQERVSALLRPWLAAQVEHVGSTAIPGLRAKPIIDMLAPVRSLSDAEAMVGVLTADGWLFWPEDPCRHYRLWFLRPRPETRSHHLHVMEHDDQHARALLGFRDALRVDPDLRERYARLKERLAERHRVDRNAYSNAKSDFVAQTLRAVGIEPPPRDRLPE